MLMIASRWLLWTVFLSGFVTAFWQYFEFAYTLYENNLIVSPIWSGMAGPPYIHHGYVGFIAAGASITILEEVRGRERKNKPT